MNDNSKEAKRVKAHLLEAMFDSCTINGREFQLTDKARAKLDQHKG